MQAFLQSGSWHQKNAEMINELHFLQQAALFLYKIFKSRTPRQKLILIIIVTIIITIIIIVTIIIIRMEEELGNPHLVSLVTDYNVMPVRNKYL